MIPGPTFVPERILSAMCRDYGSGQGDPEFLELYARTGRRLGALMGTRNDVVFMTGEGMLALWAALKSCLKSGDGVLSVVTGIFGDGIADMAASIGCRTEKVLFPYNASVDAGDGLQRIEDAAGRVKPVMLTAVHCETPSGTLNPLEGIAEIKQRLGVPLFYVDAVSSLGGVPVEADARHIDLLLGGSQKCLSAPPSMSMLAVSPAAWERSRRVGYRGYDALLPFRTVQEDGRCPYTPYRHGLAALAAALDGIEEAGIAATFARHEQAAALCRNGLTDLGIELFPAPDAVPSPTVTAALAPPGTEFARLQAALRGRGLAVAGSFGPMAGKVFRLGHMGSQADPILVQKALRIIAEVTDDLRRAQPGRRHEPEDRGLKP
jgi:aspartate aminotransferase-like enzyme